MLSLWLLLSVVILLKNGRPSVGHPVGRSLWSINECSLLSVRAPLRYIHISFHVSVIDFFCLSTSADIYNPVYDAN